MTAPTSQITIGSIDLSAYASLGLSVSYEHFGDNFLTMADGSLQHQAFYQKERFTVGCTGWAPSALREVDRSSTYDVTIPDPERVDKQRIHSGMYMIAFSEQHDVNNATVSWSATFESAAAP